MYLKTSVSSLSWKTIIYFWALHLKNDTNHHFKTCYEPLNVDESLTKLWNGFGGNFGNLRNIKYSSTELHISKTYNERS